MDWQWFGLPAWRCFQSSHVAWNVRWRGARGTAPWPDVEVKPRIRVRIQLPRTLLWLVRGDQNSFGRLKVSTPCSSCRSGTAGFDGDGEGANQSPPAPGRSIEVREGRMVIISASQQLGSYRAAAEECGTTHRTVKKVVDKFEADQAGVPSPPRAERAHNYDSVAELVAERVEESHARISAKRLLPLARAGATRLPHATSGGWSPMRRRCGATRITLAGVRRFGHRAGTWSSTGPRPHRG